MESGASGSDGTGPIIATISRPGRAQGEHAIAVSTQCQPVVGDGGGRARGVDGPPRWLRMRDLVLSVGRPGKTYGDMHSMVISIAGRSVVLPPSHLWSSS